MHRDGYAGLIGNSCGAFTVALTVSSWQLAARRLINREELEDRVLSALTKHLMQPEAIGQFCDAYVAEQNRLAASSEDSKASLERDLHRLQKEKATLIASIKAGVPAEFLKAEISKNISETQRVESALSRLSEEAPVRFHPKMADVYRDRVTALIRSLGDRREMVGSWESLRGLIEKLVLHPDARDGYAIDLSGDFGALLNLATGSTDSKVKATRVGSSYATAIPH